MVPKCPTNLRLAGCLRLLAILALAGVPAPALLAQTACEDVSGTWTVELTLPGTGASTVTLTLDQTECAVAGTIEGRNRTPFEDGAVEGSTATFTAMATNQVDGQVLAIEWAATVDGDDIAGTLQSPLFGTIPFTGSRVEG